MQRVRDKSRTQRFPGRIEERRYSSTEERMSTYSSPIVDKMVDVVTPGFRRLVNSGAVINSPMVKTEARMDGNGAAMWEIREEDDRFFRSFHVPQAAMNLLIADYAPTPALLEQEADLAITSAYADVGSPTYDAATELVEIRETLGFLFSPVKGMLEATRRVRKYVSAFERYYSQVEKRKRQKRPVGPKPTKPKFRWGRFHVDSIPSAWLAYRYAIMPLIYSFEDIEELVKRRMGQRPSRETARSKRVHAFKRVDKTPWERTTFFRTEADYQYVTRVEGKVTTRGGVLYVPDWSLSADLGFSIHRVPRVLWEAVPLSFVTDWFQNGAEVYDALTAQLRALKIEAAWLTQEIEWKVSVACVSKLVSDTGYVTEEAVYGPYTYRKKLREPKTLGDVRFRLKADMNLKRVADALSLIKTILVTTRKS